MSRKRIFGNLLFWFQIVCATIFFATQAVKMMKSTEGNLLSFFLCHFVFAVINLWLSVLAFKESTDGEKTIKKQSIFIYAMWSLFIGAHFFIALFKMPEVWKHTDTVTLFIVIAGVIFTIAVAKIKKLPLLDAYVKAGLAVFFKSVPQVALAFSIYLYGEGGLSGWWILLGNVTIITRIVHLLVSNHQGWNRNTRGSLISEIWNEASWAIASIAWIVF